MVIGARGGMEEKRIVRMGMMGSDSEGSVEWLFWPVNGPLPLFKVEIPSRRRRVPVKEALPLKESTKGENLHLPATQLV